MATKKVSNKKESLESVISELVKWNMEMQKEYLEKINVLVDKIMAKDYQQYKAYENLSNAVPSSENAQPQIDLKGFDDDWTEEVKG